MKKKLRKCILTIFTLLCCGFSRLTIKAFNTTLLDNLSATYAIVIDRDTNQVLAQKNADEKMYPASMTKMMTAIIAIENLTDLNQTIPITEQMLEGLQEEGASVAGFQVGDTPTVQDILYGIALPSGADATNAAAYTICGSIEEYVQLMNDKAHQIGMTNTHFVNTSGLHDDDHYSTARDIAKLLQYCLNNQTFETIFSSHEYTTTPLQSAPAGILLESSLFQAAQANNYSIPGLIGGKTGFTYPAGRCLASWDDVQDMHLITVVANADAYSLTSPHIADTDQILQQLQSWNQKAVLSKSDTITTITVTHPFAKEEKIEVKAPADFKYDLPEDAEATVTCKFPETIASSNSSQNITGDLTITINGEIEYTTKMMIKIKPEQHLLDKIALLLS